MRIGILFVFLMLFILQVSAQIEQTIKINVKKTSLSQVLLGLKENYGFQFAFDNDLLSQYSVSLNRTFHSEEEALQFLLKNLPLELEKSDDVFLIIPLSDEKEEEPINIFTHISGQVLEAQTYEPLPFSNIFINNKFVKSDMQGHFDFIASADTAFDLRISHLGYFIYDTTITKSISRRFMLMPQIEKIEEVRVQGNLVEKSTLIGENAGRIKINHRIAPVLPGHGDNSIFNLLRLMPGILASGEQSNDLLIWGGYESHSKIQFDGFTVFGLKNFNDNISVVNPFMVKNIEVMKGGYEARYGGRVGGIVDITGKNGTLQKPTFTFNINTTTLNSLLEVPLSEKSSVMAAYRQTYYQLYDPTTLNLFKKNKDSNSDETTQGSEQEQQTAQPETGIDFTVVPDYVFRDANLKYSYRGDNGNHLAVSLYGGGDNFLYNMVGSLLWNVITRNEEEDNQQLGGSVIYSQPWEKGGVTNFTASYSVFQRQAFEQNKTENTRNGKVRITKNITSENNVDELFFNAEHSIPFVNGNKLVVGGGAYNNNVSLLRESFDNKVIDLNSTSPRIFAYVQNELPVSDFMDLKTGLRTVFASQLKKWFLEPRISATVKFTDDLKLNASWGLYNQFIAKTSVVDSAYNFAYFWTNADEENIPVLNAQHFVGGLSYNKNGFTFSSEGYYKTTEGITRFFNGNRSLERGFYEGNARSYGLDFYLKKEYKRHLAWISYTLSKTEEHFPFYIKEYYKLAPHHQTHELKLAAIVNLNSFYISANYVYGSGFERYNFETEDGLKLNQDYKRLDASVVYKLRPGKVKAEIGLSVLNVLDTDNIKYSNLRRATVDEVSLVGIYAEAIPFTPAVFLKVEL